jgi:hypothetical protein
MNQRANDYPVPDVQRVRYVTENYRELQGLKSVVVGLFLLFIVALYDGRLPGSAWVLDSFLVLLLPLCMFGVVAILFRSIQRYYERTLGHVESDPERIRRERQRGLIAYFLVFISYSLDRNWQPPVSIGGLALAACFLVIAWPHRTYKIHYIVTAVLLAGVSLLPLGGISLDSTRTVVSVAAGLAFIVIGCIDHVLLVRTFKPVPGE